MAGSYHCASPSWAQILLHELLFQQKFMAGARLQLQLDSNFILDYPSQRLAGQWERKGDSLYLYPVPSDSDQRLALKRAAVLRYKIERGPRLYRSLKSGEQANYVEMLEKL